MNRTIFAVLVLLASALFRSPARSDDPVPWPEQATKLLVLQLSEHFDPPSDPIIDKSFWTNAEAIPHLYASDTSVSDTANVVAEQLKQIYDDHGAEGDATSIPKAVQSLVYIPGSNDTEAFEKDPISATALYKEIQEKSSAGDMAAQWWVILVRDWHRIAFEEHKPQYRLALNEAVETIPKLADAIVKTHQGVEEKSPDPPAAEPSKPGETAKDPAEAAEQPKPSHTPKDPVDAADKRTDEEKLKEILGKKHGVITELIQALKTEIGNDENKEKSIRDAFATRIREVLRDSADASVNELRRTMAQEISKLSTELLSKELHDRIVGVIAGIAKDSPLGTERKGDFEEFYTQIADRLAPPIDEAELKKLLDDNFLRIDALIKDVGKAIEDEAGDSKIVQAISKAFAKKIREIVNESVKSGDDLTVDHLRKQIVKGVTEVGDSERLSPKTQALIFGFMAGVRKDAPFGTETATVKDFVDFYTRIADRLDPIPAPPPSSSAAALPHDDDSLEALFADLQPEIFKFGKSTKELYKRHIMSFVDSLNEIIRTDYENTPAGFTRMQDDTRTKAMGLINDLKIIPNKRSRDLWTSGYQRFVVWAEKKENGKTVDGWRDSLISLAKVLADSVGVNDAATAQAEEHFKGIRATGSGTGTGSYTSSGSYATWGAVWRTRIIERRRSRYERNALRIQAIRGGR